MILVPCIIFLILTVHFNPNLEAIEPTIIHVLDCSLGIFLLAEVNHGMPNNFR